MKITVEPFGPGAQLYQLENDAGVKIAVTNFGARIVRLQLPVLGQTRDVVLGFDDLAGYVEKDHQMGATIGRVAGRIADGTFKISDTTYHTTQNEKGNTLHGGVGGFDVQYWTATQHVSESELAVTFQYVSPADDNGFPGNLTVTVTYRLDNDNNWRVDYHATSDADTLFNPTNHVYFNVDGGPEQPIGQQQLMIAADEFAPISPRQTTTGVRAPVSGTEFDFRTPQPIDQALHSHAAQNQLVNGLDHPFFLNPVSAGQPQATLRSSDGQVVVAMTTSMPSVVVFTANFPEDTAVLMRGGYFGQHRGITLEAQVAPGAERYDQFGNILLKKGTPYHEWVNYQFQFARQ